MENMKCDMKGYLSFLVLWLLNKQSMTGAEIALELEKRRGTRPSPGTIYPALKDLKTKGLITANKDKKYSLTKKGKEELESGLMLFTSMFCDFSEMKSCCKK